MRSLAGGAGRPARAEVNVGFVALSDCAPLVIARERGFFRRHGLRVVLHREPSWANIRDKLAAGVLDAAQALAPMLLASRLGLDGLALPLIAPLSLGLNGNAITVSAALFREMARLDPESVLRRPMTARALCAVIEARRRSGRPPLRFAVVFPFSPHYYELAYWLGAAGIDVTRDVEVRVVPPAAVPRSLRDGEIDGLCVGEPWNHVTVDQGLGRSVISKHEIWNNSPDKVLALTEEWADRHPERLQALLRGVLEAQAWLDRPENRREAAHVIAGESWVDAPVEVVAASLEGRFRIDRDASVAQPDFHVFHRYAAGFPWTSHAAWFLSQMLRWGQIEKPIPVRRVAASVVRPDLFREAAEALDMAAPTIDGKTEGLHDRAWRLDDASQPLTLGPDRFFDGRRFDPEDVAGYLEQFEVTRLHVRLDDLALMDA